MLRRIPESAPLRGCAHITRGMFLEECRRVAEGYDDITVEDYHVDAFAAHLVLRPESFDVIVTSNMFGDILSDQACAMVGGARKIEAAVQQVLAAQQTVTPDLGGKATTQEMNRAIAEQVVAA